MGPDASVSEQGRLFLRTGVRKTSQLQDVNLKGLHLERTGCLNTEVIVPDSTITITTIMI